MEDFKIPQVIPEHREKNKDETDELQKQSTQASGNNPYKVPKWSAVPKIKSEYKFEVLKSGVIIEEIRNLGQKAYWTFGRLGDNDISMAHPTISRYHAILQYRPPLDKDNDGDDKKDNPKEFGTGWYIYDLGSTHGTKVNKLDVPPQTYIRVHVGHMIRLGASTRCYILQGPDVDAEPESELSVTEMKELKKKELEQREALRNREMEEDGISWGMGEDADEETDLTVNPYSLTNNEELFLDDPKKTLRGFFEREGHNLEYKVEEMSAGTFVCSIELPIMDGEGNTITAEVCHKGKKKDCVLQCALEACRILDRKGVLRQANHEPMKRKKPAEDSDEDDFLDRTGDIERKKLRKAALSRNTALTYDELVKQETELLEKLSKVEEEIKVYQNVVKNKKSQSNNMSDDLDLFMNTLSSNADIDKTKIRKLRVEQQTLQTDHKQLQRLIQIAMPAKLPSLNSTETDKKKNKLLPLFGKRNMLKVTHTTTRRIHTTMSQEFENESEEEDEPTPAQEVDRINVKESEKGVSQKKTFELQNSPSRHSKDLSKNPESEENADNKDQSIRNKITSENVESNSEKDESPNLTSSKRRTRVRPRQKARDNVEEDLQLEDPEKYSGWIPPQNQSGDGLTELNQKFGY